MTGTNARFGRRLSACSVIVLLSNIPAFGQFGPDVIVGDLHQISHWGAVGDIHAYSVGTVSCNIGDQNLLWISSTNQHPVIGQNMYRLENGRIEMIGQSWLKHAFTALTQNLCDSCSGQGGSVLGVGCSDPYGSGLNGGQTRLGPRSEVNATNGAYPYPYILNWQSTGDAIFKRLQCHTNDVDINLHPTALYFVEGQYVTVDDSGFGNHHNNASYRRITINSSFDASLQDQTEREKPAIMAWVDHGLGLNTPDPDVMLVSVDDSDGGRFWVASRATDIGGDIWHYEYAVFNLNSDRSMGAIRIPLALGGMVTNIGFHDVDYHSGEPYSGADWSVGQIPTEIRWNTEAHAVNTNANALRWGTMYNFRFDSDGPPLDGAGEGAIELFKPGAESELLVAIIAPDISDCNTNGIPDDQDLGAGAPDCNANGRPDPCDIAGTASSDCNTNGDPDECDIDSGLSFDMDVDAVSDECDTCVGLFNPMQVPWHENAVDGGASGEYASIDFDADGAIVAAYRRGSSAKLKLWRDANQNYRFDIGESVLIDGSGDTGQYASMAMDPGGRAVVAYYHANDQALALWFDENGNFAADAGEIRQIDAVGNAGRHASLKYDSSGRATVSYYMRNTRVLSLWHDANGNHAADAGEITTIDNTSSVGEFTSLAFDADGRATVAYHDETSAGLRVWHDADGDFAPDAGEIQVIESDGALVGRFNSLGIDSTGRAAVAHYDATGQDLRLWFDLDGDFAFDAGEATIIEAFGAVGQYPSLVFDAFDRLLISYYRHGNNRAILWFDADGNRTWSETERTFLAIDGNVGAHSDLRLHPDFATPVVAYMNQTTGTMQVSIAVDWDADGACYLNDNCPVVANADQADTDLDGLGDTCDACATRRTGDVSGDSSIDSVDVVAFAGLLLDSGSGTADERCAADISGDGVVDGDDVDGFVALVMGE